MAEFNAWLSQFRVNKGERYSHLGMEHTRGRFYIPEDSQNEFEKKYYEHVFSQKGNCDLIEGHVELCCLLYDLDFKLPKDSKERAYTQDAIKTFIQIVTKTVSRYLHVPCSGYDAFVMEKSKPTQKKDCVKDGVHIMFPYIVTEPAIQHYFRDDVLHSTKHLFPEAINEIDDIVDVAVLDKNGWMMYGTSKPEGSPYVLTGIWEYLNEEDIGNHPPKERIRLHFILLLRI